MKAVLMSIQPYWVFLIIAKKMGWDIGKEKKLEVRKSFPKDENWNRKAEIYCSKDKKSFNRIPKEYQPFMEKFLGKAVGSFTCNSVYEWNYRQLQGLNGTINTYFPIFAEDLPKTCLTHKDIENYGKGKTLYAWHISDLKIYDKPRELSEFKKENKCYKKGDLDNIGCWERGCLIQEQGWCDGRFSRLTRPPQSWQFISLGE